jgi:enamine deaminase RidA (YjgF/YER057c/UK114 family)
MSESETSEFLEWYEMQKLQIFNHRRVLEEYCQAVVTVLRQACQVFRLEFMQIGQVEVFLDSVTNASTCNKVLRRLFVTRYYRADSQRRVNRQHELQQ